MIWQQRKQIKEVEETQNLAQNRNLKLKRLRSRLKRFAIKYAALHLWSVPAIFFLSYFTYFVADTSMYATVYMYLCEIYGYSLYSCLVLLMVAPLLDACIWHFASIFGMITHNIINIIFVNQDVNSPINMISFALWSAIIIYFIWIEETKEWKSKKAIK